MNKDELKRKLSGRRFETLEIEGVELRIRSLTEREHSGYEAGFVSDDGKPRQELMPELKSRFVALCLCDEDGNQYLTADDVGGFDSQVVNELYDRCVEHCKARNADAMAKN